MLKKGVHWLLRRLVRWRYAFEVLPSWKVTPENVLPGRSVEISGEVGNTGALRGTIYVIVAIRDPFERRQVFTSDNLDQNARESLRKVRITPGSKTAFALRWHIPNDIRPSVYDVRVELWTPAKLYKRDDWLHPEHLHYATRWEGYVNVVSRRTGHHRPTTFISYAWFSPEHKVWVERFAEELVRYDIDYILDVSDAVLGEPAIEFMKRLVEVDVVLPICSSAYVAKATSLEKSGVSFETTLAQKGVASGQPKFIPIIRDNAEGSRPPFLEDFWYSDMRGEGDSWKGTPMLRLTEAIHRYSSQLAGA